MKEELNGIKEKHRQIIDIISISMILSVSLYFIVDMSSSSSSATSSSKSDSKAAVTDAEVSLSLWNRSCLVDICSSTHSKVLMSHVYHQKISLLELVYWIMKSKFVF